MVDDEAHVREGPRGRQGRRHLAGPDQQVVGEPGRADRGDAPADIGSSDPGGIRLVVDLMADPDEPVATGPRPELGERVADARGGEVDPADDARR